MSISTIEALEAMRAILNNPGIPSTADLGFILAVLRFEAAQVAEGDTATRPALDYARQHLKSRVFKAQKFVEWAEDNELLARRAWRNIHLKAMHHYIDSLPPADLIECARCNGLRGSPLTCHVCNGQGYVFRMPAFWAVSSETLVARQEALDLQDLEAPRSRRNFEGRRAARAVVREAFSEPQSTHMRFPVGVHVGLAEEGLYPIDHDDPALDGFAMGRVVQVRMDGREVLVDCRQGFTLNGEDMSGQHVWMRPAPAAIEGQTRLTPREQTILDGQTRITSGDGEEYPTPFKWQATDNATPVLQEMSTVLQAAAIAMGAMGTVVAGQEIVPPLQLSEEDRGSIDADAESLYQSLGGREDVRASVSRLMDIAEDAPFVSSASPDTEEPP